MADFKPDSGRDKGRRELLDTLDRITPFCAALIDALVQLNAELAGFFHCYFKSDMRGIKSNNQSICVLYT